MDPTAFPIREAASPDDFDQVRSLLGEYRIALGLDLGFQKFDEELAGLPGCYVRPAGCLLLAWDGARAVGVVAMRPLPLPLRGPGSECEMKRLYVRPAARGHGLARQLAGIIIQEAGRAGYERMLLDTLPSMTAARSLYQSLGFVEIEPYYDNPLGGASFMALMLAGEACL